MDSVPIRGNPEYSKPMMPSMGMPMSKPNELPNAGMNYSCRPVSRDCSFIEV